MSINNTLRTMTTVTTICNGDIHEITQRSRASSVTLQKIFLK